MDDLREALAQICTRLESSNTGFLLSSICRNQRSRSRSTPSFRKLKALPQSTSCPSQQEFFQSSAGPCLASPARTSCGQWRIGYVFPTRDRNPALLYGGTWLVWATRVECGRALPARLTPVTAGLILGAMLGELTLRFHILPAQDGRIAGSVCAGRDRTGVETKTYRPSSGWPWSQEFAALSRCSFCRATLRRFLRCCCSSRP